MQNKKHHLIFLILLVLGFIKVKAQEPMSLYYLENVPQSNFANPAMAPRCNAFIGVPGINSIYMNVQSNLSAKTLLQNTENGAVTILSKDFDYSKFYKEIGDGLDIRTYELITPLAFGFRLKTGYVTFAMSEKIKMNGFLAADFFSLPENGAPAGSTFDLSQTGLDAQWYQEYAFGYSRNITQKLRLGARIKILQGMYAIKSDISKFDLNTHKDEWNLDVKGDIYTSAPLEIHTNDEGIIDSINLSEDFENLDFGKLLRSEGLNFSNFGLAFDLGATYDYSEMWSFSASLIDLGFINWKRNLNSIHFKGKYDFVGLEINNENIDSLANAQSDLVDSIKQVINYHAGNAKFTTGLGTTFHLGAEFHVNHIISLGFLARSTFDRNYFHQEFNISANANLYRILTANINYNIATNGDNFAGLGLALNLDPIQIYFMLDRIPLTYTNYIVDGEKIPGPYSSTAFNMMFGVNLIFGARGYKDSPKIDAYSEF